VNLQRLDESEDLQYLFLAYLALKSRHDGTKSVNQLSLWVNDRLANIRLVSFDNFSTIQENLTTENSSQSRASSPGACYLWQETQPSV
jgi:hypothetical protein